MLTLAPGKLLQVTVRGAAPERVGFVVTDAQGAVLLSKSEWTRYGSAVRTRLSEGDLDALIGRAGLRYAATVNGRRLVEGEVTVEAQA